MPPLVTPRPRTPAGRAFAGFAAAALLTGAAATAVSARQITPDPGPGGGAGPPSVTVSATPTEVVVGNDVDLEAEVTGDIRGGGWFAVCPGEEPPEIAPRPPQAYTTSTCCQRVGTVNFGYMGEYPDELFVDGDAPVTVVGPNDFQTTGFGEDSYEIIEGYPEVRLATKLLRDGKTVGACAAVLKLEALILDWDADEGEFVQTGDWIEPEWLFLIKDADDVLYIVHRFGLFCSGVSSVDIGERIGEPKKFYYRITIDGSCDEQVSRFTTNPGIIVEAFRTGDCQYELRGERDDP